MPQSVTVQLMVLVLVFAGAVAAIAYVVESERQRRQVLRRTIGGAESSSPMITQSAVRIQERTVIDKLGDWITARVPADIGSNRAVGSKLVQAGFDSPTAPAIFALMRVLSAILFPLIALAVAPRANPLYYWLAIGLAALIGVLAPQGVIDSLTASRQDMIRKGIPDALDLLVVCVESGVALDSSIQRVAREMRGLHTILAEELTAMSRRVSAGMARDQALQGLYVRTGVDELRSLASHMLQSERLGTSIATVLRVYADQLRRKRKMMAEKRAATASTRMLIPLALFIFPTIFVVLLGPAVLQISEMFDKMGQ